MTRLTARTIVTQEVPVQRTGWFLIENTEPGQPGVFEVDPLPVTLAHSVDRYAYWDGKVWHPAGVTPDDAYTLRFVTEPQVHPITAFRGLDQQVL